jgi:hypothetical protein
LTHRSTLVPSRFSSMLPVFFHPLVDDGLRLKFTRLGSPTDSVCFIVWKARQT